jgi:hypothetical protein
MESMQLSEPEVQRAEDLRWALRAPEVRQHAGKLVAVYKKRVIGVGVDRGTLIEQASSEAHCGLHNVVVIVVPSPDLADTPK